MYSTRSIASILEPVAQQVCKLMELHEDSEAGRAMDSLETPVAHVKLAVDNLSRVAKETSKASEDSKLRSELPKALNSIKEATNQLMMASSMLSSSPNSPKGRDNLIEGSRGILQGTTNMLTSFDEAQVRKMVRMCKKVLDYLAVTEILDTMEDLSNFVKDLSPTLGKMCNEVEQRRVDLLDHDHADALKQHLEQVKTLAPVLICAIKIAIQVNDSCNVEVTKSSNSVAEAIENRNYLVKRMTDEIEGIISTLSTRRSSHKLFSSKTSSSNEKSSATNKTSRIGVNILGNVQLPKYDETKSKRDEEVGPSLDELKSMLEQALLRDSATSNLMRSLTDLATRIADNFDGHVKMDVLDLATRLDVHKGDTQSLLALLNELQKRVDLALEQRLLLDLSDLCTPLDNFMRATRETESVHNFSVDEKGQQLKLFAQRICRTAQVVAMAKKQGQELRPLSTKVQMLTPQLINASAIALNYPTNKAAMENLDNLANQYRVDLERMRDVCQQVITTKTLILGAEKQLRERILVQAEEHLRFRQEEKARNELAKAVRMTNKLIMENLSREIQESEDEGFRQRCQQALSKVRVALEQFENNSEIVVRRPGDAGLITAWKGCANKLINAINDANRVIVADHPAPNPPFMKKTVSAEAASTPPPRPPLPAEVRRPMPPRITVNDDEADEVFGRRSALDRPIHQAASGLYEEVRQWDHTDNEIIAAAKKIAFLMAHLSELVRPGRGSKRELIACAKGLAEVSERITELAKELARHCTDKKIRTNLLQVCEKIPTIGTQLKVLATVKATMLGSSLSEEEDSEAMDMLVFNANKLNEAVKETVQAAESASIRVRTDAGFKLKWERKQPWFRDADYY